MLPEDLTTDESLESGIDQDSLQERQVNDHHLQSSDNEDDDKTSKKFQFFSSIEQSVEQVVNCCQNKT